LAITSPIGGGRSVGIVRSRTILALQFVCVPSPFVNSTGITWWWTIWVELIHEKTCLLNGNPNFYL
jgi:hypothetical protein